MFFTLFMDQDINKKISLLEKKKKKYEKRLSDKRLGYGKVVRTRYGDPYEDQLRDDTNALESVINSIDAEIESLRKK